MELHLICQNISQMSKQLTIIQDYITLKFGLDFQEFCKTRMSVVENPGQSIQIQNKNVKSKSTPSISASTSNIRASTNKRTFGASSTTFTNAFIEGNKAEKLFLDSQNESEVSDFDIIQIESIKEEPEEFNMGSFIPGDEMETNQSDDNHSEGDGDNTASDPDYETNDNGWTAGTEDTEGDHGQFKGELEVVPSRRGKNKIHLAGFRYFFRSSHTSGTIAWSCDDRSNGRCNVRLITSADMTKVIKHFRFHDHEPTPEKSQRIKQISLIKNLSVLSTDQPSALISSTFSQLDENDRKTLPRVDAMKNLIRRTRNKNAAAMPVGHIMPGLPSNNT